MSNRALLWSIGLVLMGIDGFLIALFKGWLATIFGIVFIIFSVEPIKDALFLSDEDIEKRMASNKQPEENEHNKKSGARPMNIRCSHCGKMTDIAIRNNETGRVYCVNCRDHATMG